jgi:hypothetical protein
MLLKERGREGKERGRGDRERDIEGDAHLTAT